MTRTPTSAPAPVGPASIPRPRVVRERAVRRGRLGVAIALMAVCALAAVALFGYVSRAQPYLALARDVAVGAQITAADLVTVHVNPDPALKAVPAEQSRNVVGKHAAISLLSGMLLPEKALTDQPFPAPGEQVVGLALKTGQMPSAPVRPGARALLVSTEEIPAGAGDAGPPVAAPSVPATVVHVVAGVRDGTATVSVAVKDRDGPLVARLAAQGRLALTLTPER